MPRYVPTLRGWLALILPLLGGFSFLAMLPARFIQSGWGEFIAAPIAPSVCLFGGALGLVCVAACVEAFRRGSLADRVVCCVGSLVTLWLLQEFFWLMLLPVQRSPL